MQRKQVSAFCISSCTSCAKFFTCFSSIIYPFTVSELARTNAEKAGFKRQRRLLALLEIKRKANEGGAPGGALARGFVALNECMLSLLQPHKEVNAMAIQGERVMKHILIMCRVSATTEFRRCR
jgi:hypothetical protein